MEPLPPEDLPEDAGCALCGSDQELVPDPDIADLFICRTCLARARDHDAAIHIHGFEADEPKIE